MQFVKIKNDVRGKRCCKKTILFFNWLNYRILLLEFLLTDFLSILLF